MDKLIRKSAQLSDEDENFIKQLLGFPSQLDGASSSRLSEDDDRFKRQLLELPLYFDMNKRLRDFYASYDAAIDIRKMSATSDEQKGSSNERPLSSYTVSPTSVKCALLQFMEYHLKPDDDNYSFTMEDMINLVCMHGRDGMYGKPHKSPSWQEPMIPNFPKTEKMYPEVGPYFRMTSEIDLPSTSVDNENLPELTEDDLVEVLSP